MSFYFIKSIIFLLYFVRDGNLAVILLGVNDKVPPVLCILFHYFVPIHPKSGFAYKLIIMQSMRIIKLVNLLTIYL